MNDLFSLAGRTALVTGGSRGLGLQMAHALGEAGARIMLTSRKAGGLEEATAGLQAAGIDARWIAASASRPRASVRTVLAGDLPDAVAVAVLGVLGIPADRPSAELGRDDRRRLVHALTEWPLPITDTRGYNYAEVTSGGVDLTEIDPATMESRVCPGLYLVGEILDVDGRIGGFNFQWAWSSAHLAGRAVAAVLPSA